MKIMFFFTHKSLEVINVYDDKCPGFNCNKDGMVIVIKSSDDRKMIYQYIDFETGWAEECKKTIKAYTNKNDSLILCFHTEALTPNNIKDGMNGKIKDYNVIAIEKFGSEKTELWGKITDIKKICQKGEIASGKEKDFKNLFDDIWLTYDMKAKINKVHSLRYEILSPLVALDLITQEEVEKECKSINDNTKNEVNNAIADIKAAQIETICNILKCGDLKETIESLIPQKNSGHLTIDHRLLVDVAEQLENKIAELGSTG